jgi:aminocarboxymuconate-semialdehyde decarboxylase
MTTRRHFLKMSAGIIFCGCGLLHRTHGETLARQKLPVTIGGKRIKTIDVHAHCQFPEAVALFSAGAAASTSLADGRLRSDVAAAAYVEIDKRLASMDAQAVDMEVLSINPFWYGSERDLAGQIVKLQNEKLAEFCAAKPDRFAAFASLTLQAPDLAVQELETAVRKQGLKGAAIGGTMNGEAFSDPRFHPVWSTCPCSFIRRASRSLRRNWPATAFSPTRSVIPSRQQSRYRTSSSRESSIAFRSSR